MATPSIEAPVRDPVVDPKTQQVTLAWQQYLSQLKSEIDQLKARVTALEP